MIPTNQEVLTDYELTIQPTNTYCLQINNNRVIGKTDNIEAMKQAIYLILNTERYQYAIYSWNYGVELEDLFGQDANFVIAKLETRIKEALLQDSRIIDVTDFEFTKGRHQVAVKFKAITNVGDVEIEKVVTI